MKTSIDSYVFIDIFLHSPKETIAVNKIKNAISSEAIVSSMLIVEVKYQLIKKLGHEKAEEAIFAIKNIENLNILSVTAEMAEIAADIRVKYYKKNHTELSYADAIHIATAIVSNSDVFITGDPDFKYVQEVKTEIY